MSNLVPSLIRTYVPLAVGYLVAYLTTLGVPIDDDTRGHLVLGLGAVVSALYYTLARVLERKFPQLTFLLGSPVQPVAYTPTATPTVDAVVAEVGKHETPDA